MDLRLAGAIRPAVIVMAAALSTGPAGAQVAKAPPPTELVPVLERAGRYVLDYEERFQNVAAVETRTQTVLARGTTVRRVEGAVPAEPLHEVCIWAGADLRCVRATEADVVFVRLEGERGFRVFRDIFKVNTMPVRTGELRLERLFADRPAAAVRQAESITELGRAAYDVGPRLRELNSPTLVLLFLHPDNQWRFSWAARGKRRFGNVEAVEIAFEETARLTIVRQPDGGDLPALGRVWVDTSRGTIVRSEMEFRFGERARATVSAEYRPDRDLAMWVPVELDERYEDVKGFAPVFGGATQTSTKYSSFHRFAAAPANGTAAAEASANPELVALLRRAGEYVTGYESSFANLVTEETYRQSVSGWQTRTTKAELVFVRLAGEFPWASYRDVFDVDGKKVRDNEERLMELFSKPRPDLQEQANRLLAASAAYNIGPVHRTVNLPTLPLVFLLPDNQGRFAFRLGERRTIESAEVVELLFAETARPTLVHGPKGSDLPASGRFWLNPARGTVVRTEVDFDFGFEAEARMTTDYQPSPGARDVGVRSRCASTSPTCQERR